MTSTWEATRHEWVPVEDVAGMDLHPGFAESWPEVRALLRPPTRVMFVCFGNVCRSQLAALILRRMAADAGVAVEVASAGTWAAVDQGIDAGTAACAERHGLEVTEHVARQMAPADVAASDIVVSLAADATPIVERIASRLSKPPVILNRPALNPWGMDADAHDQTYAQLAATCREVVKLTTVAAGSRPS